MNNLADLQLTKESDQVFRNTSEVFSLTTAHMAFLKHQAAKAPLQRSRICIHLSDDAILHEMIIALKSGSYVQPHKHIAKSESYHILEGKISIFTFSSDGSICGRYDLMPGETEYVSIQPDVWHTVVVQTDFAIIHEVTQGPFRHDSTINAEFAPHPSQKKESEEFIVRLTA